MGLNIKNDEVNELVTQLAVQLGVSKTEAIKIAVKERISRGKELQRRQFLNLIKETKKLATHLPDHGTLLFDEKGMPS